MTQAQQPEALKLAEWAKQFLRNVNDPGDFRWKHMEKAAAELLRQHAIIEALEQDRLTRMRQNDRMAERIADLEEQLAAIGAAQHGGAG